MAFIVYGSVLDDCLYCVVLYAVCCVCVLLVARHVLYVVCWLMVDVECLLSVYVVCCSLIVDCWLWSCARIVLIVFVLCVVCCLLCLSFIVTWTMRVVCCSVLHVVVVCCWLVVVVLCVCFVLLLVAVYCLLLGVPCMISCVRLDVVVACGSCPLLFGVVVCCC